MKTALTRKIYGLLPDSYEAKSHPQPNLEPLIWTIYIRLFKSQITLAVDIQRKDHIFSYLDGPHEIFRDRTFSARGPYIFRP